MLEWILLICSIMAFFLMGSIGWAIGSYNTFRVGQQDIKTQWGNILAEYQRRADLFYNLVQTVKSHKKFEQETLVQVIQARSGNFGQTKASQISKMKGLDAVFSKLMVLFERYPKLSSNEQHNKLMEELRITEDTIRAARVDYNEIVGDYNKLVTTFPKNIIAGMFKFSEELFFKNEEGTSKAPKIEL
jgi:LemA protein